MFNYVSILYHDIISIGMWTRPKKTNKQTEGIQRIKTFTLNLLFPKSCFFCGAEESYVCQNCHALFDILDGFYCLCHLPKRLAEPGKCSSCKTRVLDGLLFPLPYESKFTRRLIHSFKYEPFLKSLAEDLAFFIINHLQLTQKENAFSDFLLIPVPLAQKRLKWRGFNQSEELARELSGWLQIPLSPDCLIKIKTTLPQVELSESERQENIRNAFSVKNDSQIARKKILLIDDVYTTGATMEECARILKASGAKQVWGLAVARG